MFWGLNTEIGFSKLRAWGMELRPIIGYRSDSWPLSFNPILNMNLSSNFSRQPQFEPALKVAEGVQAGFEYYGGYGYANSLLPANERTHYLYSAVDIEKHDFDINPGIGRGDSNAPDSQIAG